MRKTLLWIVSPHTTPFPTDGHLGGYIAEQPINAQWKQLHPKDQGMCSYNASYVTTTLTVLNAFAYLLS